MRRKLNEIRNKEEGFTLVELLAVIVILGIIVAIAIPSVGKVIKSSEDKAKAADIELIKDAARIYFTTDEEAIKEVKAGGAVTVPVTSETDPKGLIELGYLDLDVTKDGKEIHAGKEVTFKDGKVTYPVTVPED